MPNLFGGPVHIKWQDGTHAPVGCAFNTAVVLEGKVYIGGGHEGKEGTIIGTDSYRIDVYTPANNSWSPPIKVPFCQIAMATLNNHLIIAGGRDIRRQVTNKILLLDGDQLKEYTTMTVRRCCATAFGYQGILIIVGGDDNLHKRLASTELFDSTTRQWYNVGDLPLPHCKLKSVMIDNILYLVGGVDQGGNNSSTVFTTSLHTLSSHQLEWSFHHLNNFHAGSAPMSIQSKSILMIGGSKKGGRGHVYLSAIHIFNKANHSLQIMAHIPSARYGPTAVSTADNEIVVVGGWDEKGLYTDTVWIGTCEPQ